MLQHRTRTSPVADPAQAGPVRNAQNARRGAPDGSRQRKRAVRWSWTPEGRNGRLLGSRCGPRPLIRSPGPAPPLVRRARSGGHGGQSGLRFDAGSSLPGRWSKKRTPPRFRGGVLRKAPGDDLLLHGLSHTTIGAAAFHFRVRDGIGWDHSAKVARELVRVAQSARTRHWDLGRKQAFGTVWPNLSLRPASDMLSGEASWSYMIKPHGSLVSVSSALLRYTPDLSTT